MNVQRTRLSLVLISMTLVMTACASLEQQPAYSPPKEAVPDPTIVQIPIVTTQRDKQIIPKGSRFVIANIDGPCATEVKDALMQRLVDNADYDVLTRDNLAQILEEFGLATSSSEYLFGKFNDEAVTAIGELLGASYFIVGRVSYCGESASNSPDSHYGKQFNVHATLQILDLKTGKVLLSSASRGHYFPLPASSLPSRRSRRIESAKNGGPPPALNNTRPVAQRARSAVSELLPAVSGALLAGNSQSVQDNLVMKAMDLFGPKRTPQPSPAPAPIEPLKRKSSSSEGSQLPEPEDSSYLKVKAAEAMANEFADKFFARSTWEVVKMWHNPEEMFSRSTRHVQLGHCNEAVDFLGNIVSGELENMEESRVAKYLHNYGVALLCANESAKAIRKLQSAYRISHNDITLDMLGLAARIDEWSLHVEIDEEPEVGILMRRDIFARDGCSR